MIAYEYFTYDSEYEIVAFAVEKNFIRDELLYDLPIIALENLEKHFPSTEYDAFVAIPASQLNRLRSRLFKFVKDKGYKCATYVSSRAFVWRNAIIGENCFIFEDNTIQPFVEIGNNVILWSGNHIGHRTVIEDDCFLASHVVVSGYCRIGRGSFLGVNSTFNDKVSVAPNCIVASGALVTKNLDMEAKVYYGAPAKEMPNPPNSRSWQDVFNFAQSCAKAFLPAYLPIVEKRLSIEYGQRERDFQLYRRGRYVEFNLVFDRGTIFGLQTNGRTESILMSLPPLVRWEYGYQPEPNTPESKLYEVFLKPQDWVNWSDKK